MGRADTATSMSPDVVKDFEEWLLIKADALRYDHEQAEQMPVSRVYHFYGFEQAQKKIQEEEQRNRERMAQYKQFVE